MNSLKLALENSLESWGVVNPFNLKSSFPKKMPTTDSTQNIINKFEDAISNTQREKVTAVDSLVKKVVFLPLGSLYSYCNMNFQGGMLYSMVGAFCGVIFSTPALNYANDNLILNLAKVAITVYYLGNGVLGIKVGSDIALSEIKDQINKIKSDFKDLNELKIKETNLKNGQCDFLLIRKTIDELDPDIINVIGQNIFEKAASPQKIIGTSD